MGGFKVHACGSAERGSKAGNTSAASRRDSSWQDTWPKTVWYSGEFFCISLSFLISLHTLRERTPSRRCAHSRSCVSCTLGADLYLVIKTKGGSSGSPAYQNFFESLVGIDRVMVIDELLGEDEIKSLIWCSDCFVSLHRSEGFGFGLSAAMFLGKPVVATGYSGNLDYMTEENSCLVRYSLCPVPKWSVPLLGRAGLGRP